MAAATLTTALRAVNEGKAQLKEFQKDIDDVGDKAEKAANRGNSAFGAFGKGLLDVGKIAGGFVLGAGILKAPGFFMDAAKGAAEDAAAMERLHQTFRNYANMVGAEEGTFEKLNSLLDERITTGAKLAFTDDQMRNSFNLLLTATDDSTEAVKRQKAAMDLARGANISLETASKMLGKINEENVDTFKKLGIELPKTATEADALAAVQARFGGQAEAYANSTAGQFERAKISMAEMKESLGAQLLPVLTTVMTFVSTTVIPKMEEFMAIVGPRIEAAVQATGKVFREDIMPAVRQFVEYAQPKIQEFAESTVKVFREHIIPAAKAFIEYVKPKIAEFADYAGEKFKEFKGYYETDIKPALENIQKLIQYVVDWTVEHWPEIERVVKPVIEQVIAQIQIAKDIIVNVLQIIIDLIGGDFSGAWNNLKELIGGVRDYIGETINNAAELVTNAAPLMLEAGKKVGGALKDGILDALSAAGGAALDFAKALGNAIARLINENIIRPINRALEFSFDTHVPGLGVININPPDIPDIPMMAKGGIVTRPTLAVVGEAGPEAVIPLSRAGGAGFASFGGDQTVIIQIDGAEVGRAVIRQMGRGYA